MLSSRVSHKQTLSLNFFLSLVLACSFLLSESTHMFLFKAWRVDCSDWRFSPPLQLLPNPLNGRREREALLALVCLFSPRKTPPTLHSRLTSPTVSGSSSLSPFLIFLPSSIPSFLFSTCLNLCYGAPTPTQASATVSSLKEPLFSFLFHIFSLPMLRPRLGGKLNLYGQSLQSMR